MNIGLIAGIGLAATVTNYTRFIEPLKTEEHPLKLTVTDDGISVLGTNSGANNAGAHARVLNSI